MKYHSYPKPVRIRIESGGEEHFSLDSLLCCFNPKDILGKKNELLRWLEFQGEEGERIIRELHDTEFNRDHVYDIYKAFFSEYINDHNISSLTELYTQWHAEDVYFINFSFLKKFCYNDEMLLERLYTEKCTNTLESDWLGVIESFVFKHYCVNAESNVFDIHTIFKDEIGNPNLLYFLGILYKENDEFDKAKMILNIAKEKGCKKQIQKIIIEIDDILDYLTKKYRFYEVRKDVMKVFIEYLFKYWTNNWGSIYDVIRECNDVVVPISEKEKAILQLAFYYKDAQTYDFGSNRPTNRYRRIKFITKTDEHDFLKKEKDFIRIISGYDEGGNIEVDSRKEMKALSETYIPARYMIDKNYKNELLDKSQFRTKNVPDRVKIILCNMFSFEE